MLLSDIVRQLEQNKISSFRTTHCKGSSQSLSIKNHGDKITAHCYRCGYHQKYVVNLEVHPSIQRGDHIIYPGTARLDPRWIEYLNDLNLLQYTAKGSTPFLQVASLEGSNRMVISTPSGQIAAKSWDENPKWLTLAHRPYTLVKGVLPARDTTNITFVEDYLSAFKVALDTPSNSVVVAVHGNNCDCRGIQLTDYDHITLWFDNDGGGRRGQANLFRKIRPLLTNQIVWERITKHDPKYYDSLVCDAYAEGELISLRPLNNHGEICGYVDSRKDCNQATA